ncbi:hypothetical protein CP973_33100 [Streptomyces albofaciens JCM 4342]|uniref:hypothetical protein n=1 Tax=Streptomyces albofaciens TaxID=66866 RepID=UPI00123C318A|nr:hypothetical protein [Streptomyces albofaciens]KAA6213998.1 hypothetical protein CP973_33100 [Streptomyces albofaciens JCM 4342]
MTITRRRSLVRTTAVAAVAGSAMLLPAAAAFADSPQPTTAGSPGAAGDQQQKDDRQKGGQKRDDQKNDNGQKSDNGPKGDNDQRKGDRKLVRTQNLSGGFLAKVYKLGPNHFQADMYAKDPGTGKLVKMDTLETKGGKPAYGRHNGAHFVLRSDGTLTSWVEGGDKKDEKKGEGKDGRKGAHPGEKGNQRQDGGQQTKVTPKGGVKAGAEGVGGTPDTPAVLLAGGGAAAAAAGLGFALLHRRKAREDA